MEQFFYSGRLIDVALVVIALEIVVLLASRVFSRVGIQPLDLIGQLLAGALLLLAVRCAVTRADYRWVLVLLSASFPAHAFDLVRRARQQGRP
jgi:hypothetical protein